MKDTGYAYATTYVRALENTLLTPAVTEQLLSARDYADAVRLLTDKGYRALEGTGDFSRALALEADTAWETVQAVLPDPHELDFLLVKNDFQNLKAALKAAVGGHAGDYTVTPSLVSAKELSEAVRNRKFTDLPLFLRDTAAQAYEILARSADGQLADAVIDCAALSEILSLAKMTGNEMIVTLSEQLCASADIKTVLRAIRTGKDEKFLEDAVCPCETLDKRVLLRLHTVEALCEYLLQTGYDALAEGIKSSDTAFEKACDDLLTRTLQQAKLMSFGIEPVMAWYLAKMTEIKNVRILLSCKNIGLPKEVIAERMRALYV